MRETPVTITILPSFLPPLRGGWVFRHTAFSKYSSICDFQWCTAARNFDSCCGSSLPPPLPFLRCPTVGWSSLLRASPGRGGGSGRKEEAPLRVADTGGKFDQKNEEKMWEKAFLFSSSFPRLLLPSGRSRCIVATLPLVSHSEGKKPYAPVNIIIAITIRIVAL